MDKGYYYNNNKEIKKRSRKKKLRMNKTILIIIMGIILMGIGEEKELDKETTILSTISIGSGKLPKKNNRVNNLMGTTTIEIILIITVKSN